jgi:uncharacterized SAM-binding protein YcdF (DUF218 family)
MANAELRSAPGVPAEEGASPQAASPARGGSLARWPRRAWRWLLLLGLLGLLLYTTRAPLLRAFAACWVVDDPLVKSDAIVVLGGDSPEGERVQQAVRLYRDGWAPRIVLSGPPLRRYLSEGDLMEREALELGAPKEALMVLRHGAMYTLAEMLELRKYFLAHNLHQVIVVTSNFHTRRVRMIGRALMPQYGIQMRTVGAPSPLFDQAHWWESRRGLSTMFLEIPGIAYAWWELRHLPPELSQTGSPSP